MLDSISAMPVVSALGWAVLHFLWQGCVIAGLAALALSGLSERSAQARYVVGCVALACSLLAFGMTFAVALPLEGPPTPALLPLEGTPTPALFTILPFAGSSASVSGIDTLVPVIAWLWCVGVFLMTARFTVQWIAAYRIKREATADVDDHARRLFDTLCRELGVHRAIRFLRSRLAKAPMVVGWFSPVVVVPVSALTSLTPDQLRAVLAHELAHIRRHDYLVNGIQYIIDIILFFHPAVWWLSSQVRHEREQCCDDIAVHTAGNPLVLAKALSQLEALRIERTQVALAANGGILMQRIERILGINANTRPMASGWRIATFLTVALALVASGIVHAAASDERAELHSKPKAQALQEAVNAQGADREAVGKRLEAAGVRIKAAVANGEMTGDEAWAEWYAVKDEIITGAVEAGEISEGEAAAYRQEIHKGELGERLKAAGGRIKAAVASGEMTEEQAWAEWQAAKEELITEAVDAGEVSEEDAAAFRHEIHKGELGERLKAAGGRIKTAVASGEMTEEEAEARLVATRKHMFGNDGN